MTVEKSWVPGLLRLGDNATGDAQRSTGAGPSRNGVNDNRGPSIAEDRVFVRAESDIRRDGADVGGAVCADNQCKVRDIPGWHTFMGVSPTKVRTGGLEVRRLAFRNLVNVEGVLTRGKILAIDGDFDALGRRRQNRRADALALRILDVHSDGLCSCLGTTILRKSRTRCRQKQRGTNERFHLRFSSRRIVFQDLDSL